jgi:hypothetical protein
VAIVAARGWRTAPVVCSSLPGTQPRLRSGPRPGARCVRRRRGRPSRSPAGPRRCPRKAADNGP